MDDSEIVIVMAERQWQIGRGRGVKIKCKNQPALVIKWMAGDKWKDSREMPPSQQTAYSWEMFRWEVYNFCFNPICWLWSAYGTHIQVVITDAEDLSLRVINRYVTADPMSGGHLLGSMDWVRQQCHLNFCLTFICLFTKRHLSDRSHLLHYCMPGSWLRTLLSFSESFLTALLFPSFLLSRHQNFLSVTKILSVIIWFGD